MPEQIYAMRQQEKEKEKERSKNVSNIQVDYNSMHKVCACVKSVNCVECVCENVRTCVDISIFVHHTFVCTHVSCIHANILTDTRILTQTYKHEHLSFLSFMCETQYISMRDMTHWYVL